MRLRILLLFEKVGVFFVRLLLWHCIGYLGQIWGWVFLWVFNFVHCFTGPIICDCPLDLVLTLLSSGSENR